MKSRHAIPIILVTHNAEEERYLGDKYIRLPSNAASPVVKHELPAGYAA